MADDHPIIQIIRARRSPGKLRKLLKSLGAPVSGSNESVGAFADGIVWGTTTAGHRLSQSNASDDPDNLGGAWLRGQAAVDALSNRVQFAALALAIKSLVNGDRDHARVIADRCLEDVAADLQHIIPTAKRAAKDIAKNKPNSDPEGRAALDQLIQMAEILASDD